MAPFDHLNRGDVFHPYAEEWNAMLDIARDFQPPAVEDQRPLRSSTYTFMTVVAGESIPQYAVVRTTLADPTKEIPPTAVIADDNNDERYEVLGIAQAPIANANVGRVMIQGISQIKVEMRHSTHRWCHPSTGVSPMESSLRGPFKIGAGDFNAAAETDMKVQFPFADEHEYEGTANGAIAKGDTTATVTVNGWDQTDVHFDRYFNPADPDISDGQQVGIRWFPDERLWRIIRARCEP